MRSPSYSPIGTGLSELPPLNWDVCRLIGGGDSGKAIAAELGLSVHTVYRHLEHIYRKLDVRCRAGEVIPILQLVSLRSEFGRERRRRVG
jgi:DNA-binding NarL/FixJ family response regulator